MSTGGWSRFGTGEFFREFSGDEMAAISKGWFMLFTMELILRGDPEAWVQSPGTGLRLGEPPMDVVPAEPRFLLPRFLPSRAWPWLAGGPSLAEEGCLPPRVPEEAVAEKKIFLLASLSSSSMSDPSSLFPSGRILGGPSAYCSTPPVLWSPPPLPPRWGLPGEACPELRACMTRKEDVCGGEPRDTGDPSRELGSREKQPEPGWEPPFTVMEPELKEKPEVGVCCSFCPVALPLVWQVELLSLSG